jgi:alpha-beta hydrolase superfamily lysophospholipase
MEAVSGPVIEPVIETLERAGASLALHRWLPPEPRAAVLYVHGTQSHAGWLFETGPALADRGVAVYALDRRGAGRSSGDRGDIDSPGTWLDDHAAALGAVRARHPAIPLAIIGQSMGAPIAAAVAARHPEAHDAVLFSAPALDNLHASRPAEWRDRIRAESGPALHDIRTPLEDFTRDERYLRWMQGDPLRLRQMSVRFVASWLELEVHCRALPDGALARASALLQPRVDRVVDTGAARALYDRLSGGRGVSIQLPTEDHYLEFSTARRAWLELVAAFVRSGGFAGAT